MHKLAKNKPVQKITVVSNIFSFLVFQSKKTITLVTNCCNYSIENLKNKKYLGQHHFNYIFNLYKISHIADQAIMKIL